MNTQTIVALCESFLSRVEQSYLVQALGLLNLQYDKYWPMTMALVEGVKTDTLGQRINGYTVSVPAGIVQIVGDIDPEKLYLDANATRSDIVWLRAEFAAGDGSFTVESVLQDFVAAYTEFMRVQNAYNFVLLLQNAHTTSLAFMTFIETIKFFVLQAKPAYTLDPGEGLLEIYFEGEHDLMTVAQKIAAIHNLYFGIAQLVDEEPIVPLRLRRLESGSVDIKISGAKGIVAAMKSLVLFASHRRYSAHSPLGRLDMLKAELVNAVKLHKVLEEAGLDTSTPADSIDKITGAINEQLDIIVSGDSGIQIDSQSFSPSPSLLARLFLQSGKTTARIDEQATRLSLPAPETGTDATET
jgi:hypothetical protein